MGDIWWSPSKSLLAQRVGRSWRGMGVTYESREISGSQKMWLLQGSVLFPWNSSHFHHFCLIMEVLCSPQLMTLIWKVFLFHIQWPLFAIVFLFYFLDRLHSMWGSSFPGPGIKHTPPVLEAWSLNHWNSQGSPTVVFLINILIYVKSIAMFSFFIPDIGNIILSLLSHSSLLRKCQF